MHRGDAMQANGDTTIGDASDQAPQLYLPLINFVWIALGGSLAAVLVGAGSYLLAASVT
jgi:hypothetical protein